MNLLLSLIQIIISFLSLAHGHPNNASDQHALLSFKNSIVNAPYNTAFNNWHPNATFCNWKGVKCSPRRQRVVALNVSSMGLEGSLSPFLANITFLQSLDISNNSFHGSIPEELGALFRLKELLLSKNGLEGSIPVTLAHCQKLVYLDLSDNHLSGTIPVELGFLRNLKYLRLGVNNLTGTIPFSLENLAELLELNLKTNNLHGPIPTALYNCTCLQQLVLHQNQLTGHIPSELGSKLTNLQLLHLSSNYLVGNIPISIANCSKLKDLGLHKNQLSGFVPTELGKLALLEILRLQNNHLVSSRSTTLPFLTHLTNCSHLRWLIFSDNQLSGVLPSTVGKLSKKLTYFSLHDNQIGGSIPHQIGNLTNLTYLGFHFNLFNGSIPPEFRRLQKMERLRLQHNKLEGSIPNEISQLKGLGELLLHQNMLSGSIPDSLGLLQQLRRLSLSENQLSGKIPATIGNFWRLEMLDLSHNKLTGTISPEVGNLPNLLSVFNLSWNSLKGSLPAEMGKMTMVQAIDTSFNKLTGVLPEALGSCAELQYLNLSHNGFQGPTPLSFGELKSLEDMDLSSNNLSGTIPASLGKLKLLSKVNFSFNNLMGEIPKEGVFANITASSFMGNPGLCGPRIYLPACPIPTSSKRRNHSLQKSIIILVASVSAFILCSFLVGFFWKHSSSLSKALLPKHAYPRVTYQELVDATNGFSEANLLGAGSFGSVYKGVMNDGTIIAVKVLNLEDEAARKSFNKECTVLGRTRHRNLIRIITSCSNLEFKALVLQFMSNGSLEKHLYPQGDDSNGGDVCGLSLIQRLNIVIDTANAMAYLHHDNFMQVVHCDLKPSNILLDDNMTAHVTDFGIARLACRNSMDSLSSTQALKGSIGYIAPEYGLGVRVSTKGDVYSYGIMLLEMLTRKRPTNNIFVEGLNLPKWVSVAFPNRVVEVLDRSLLRDASVDGTDQHEILNCIVQLMRLALFCTRESPEERPRKISRMINMLGTRGNIGARCNQKELEASRVHVTVFGLGILCNMPIIVDSNLKTIVRCPWHPHFQAQLTNISRILVGDEKHRNNGDLSPNQFDHGDEKHANDHGYVDVKCMQEN
eukprot:Gb_22823 [translate_table: standard]